MGGKNSGRKAAEAANAGAERGVEELRRQFDFTQENINPFIEAGTEALPGIVDSSTLGGFDRNLADILNSEIFGSLVGERQRAVQGQLSAGGLTRSGTAIDAAAAIPSELALAIEGLLFGRQSGLAGSGQNAAAGLGAIGAQNSQNISNLFSQQGQNTSSGILADSQARSAGIGQVVGLASSIFFSDERLKENTEVVSKIMDLDVLQWDWRDFTDGTIVELFPKMGFLAQDVEEKYPHHVGEFCGWKAINYKMLLDELADKIQTEKTELFLASLEGHDTQQPMYS